MVVVIRFRGLHSDCRVPLTSLMVLADNMHVYVDSLFHEFFTGKIFWDRNIANQRSPYVYHIIFKMKSISNTPPPPLVLGDTPKHIEDNEATQITEGVSDQH